MYQKFETDISRNALLGLVPNSYIDVSVSDFHFWEYVNRILFVV